MLQSKPILQCRKLSGLLVSNNQAALSAGRRPRPKIRSRTFINRKLTLRLKQQQAWDVATSYENATASAVGGPRSPASTIESGGRDSLSLAQEWGCAENKGGKLSRSWQLVSWL